MKNYTINAKHFTYYELAVGANSKKEALEYAKNHPHEFDEIESFGAEYELTDFEVVWAEGGES